MSRKLLGLLIVAAVLALAPLAQSTPPDQTWIGGLYDNADYDDVVLLITGGVSTVESGILWSLWPVSKVISTVVPGGDQLIPLIPFPSSPSRAPPTA